MSAIQTLGFPHGRKQSHTKSARKDAMDCLKFCQKAIYKGFQFKPKNQIQQGIVRKWFEQVVDEYQLKFDMAVCAQKLPFLVIQFYSTSGFCLLIVSILKTLLIAVLQNCCTSRKSLNRGPNSHGMQAQRNVNEEANFNQHQWIYVYLFRKGHKPCRFTKQNKSPCRAVQYQSSHTNLSIEKSKGSSESISMTGHVYFKTLGKHATWFTVVSMKS